jgi:hypothetical protein
LAVDLGGQEWTHDPTQHYRSINTATTTHHRDEDVCESQKKAKIEKMALIIRRADDISVDVVPVEMLSLISAEQWHDICSVVKVTERDLPGSFSFPCTVGCLL